MAQSQQVIANVKKSKLIVFHRKSIKPDLSNMSIKMERTKFSLSQNVKYLSLEPYFNDVTLVTKWLGGPALSVRRNDERTTLGLLAFPILDAVFYIKEPGD